MHFPLALILFIAGLFHLFLPQLFLVAMPPCIPMHFEVVILTGFIELLLSGGLAFSHTRKVTGFLCAAYFVAILPAHIHVSMNNIPMFGISSPILLWGRTLFQGVFITWAFFIAKRV